MKTVYEVIQLLTVAALGVFAGAQLTEGFVLVPFWQSLSAADFFAWYAANDERLLGFFAPLTTATVLVTIAAALGALWRRHADGWLWVVAATLMIAAVATFFVYFEDANARFSAATISSDALPAELMRWATWHWVRTGCSLTALAAGLLALSWRRRGAPS
jgi:hypothetical protein